MEDNPVTLQEIELLRSKYLEINQFYIDKLKPAIMVIKSLAYPDNIPIAFPLEIRAFITHLSRAQKIFEPNIENLNSFQIKTACENLDKAQRHYSRCLLDCDKWMCIYFEDQIDAIFNELSAKLPLVEIDNGNYLKEIHEKQRSAYELHRDAKRLDAKGDESANEKYEKAAGAYNDVYALLKNPGESRKVQMDKLASIEKTDSFNIYKCAFIGLAVAIVGLVVNFF